MAPRHPPVDLSEPLPSSTPPPVGQADLEAVLAAIEDLNTRLPAESEDTTAPAPAATAADIEASVARAIGDLESRIAAGVDEKIKAALDEVRSQFPDPGKLSDIAEAVGTMATTMEKVTAALATVGEGLETSAQTQRVLAKSVAGLNAAEALLRDGAKDAEGEVRLAECLKAVEAGFAAQRTALTTIRDAVTAASKGTAETLSGIEIALDGTGSGIRNLDSAFGRFRKMVDLHQVHVEKLVGSMSRRLHWIFWPVALLFVYEVFRYLAYRLS